MATVLVVDDDRLTVQALTVLLQNSKHTVLPAIAGPQALTWLESVRPDVVLLDLNMPGLDGFGLLWNLSQDARTRAMPIVILTGQPEALEGRKIPPNVVEVLRKPQEPDDILKAIEKAIHGPLPSRS